LKEFIALFVKSASCASCSAMRREIPRPLRQICSSLLD
jgi:hypothetical protein